jgi:malate dehydrogenase (oxaloacetate-decarboxylating)
VAEWRVDPSGRIGLHDVVRHVRPTILIGASAQPGAFTEPIIRDMAAATERPIVFPLSNPTARTEAVPADIVDWTSGRAFVATGSPYPPVEREGRRIRIGDATMRSCFQALALVPSPPARAA